MRIPYHVLASLRVLDPTVLPRASSLEISVFHRTGARPLYPLLVKSVLLSLRKSFRSTLEVVVFSGRTDSHLSFLALRTASFCGPLLPTLRRLTPRKREFRFDLKPLSKLLVHHPTDSYFLLLRTRGTLIDDLSRHFPCSRLIVPTSSFVRSPPSLY